MSSNRPSASGSGPDRHCDPEGGCVTCGDVAEPMRILALDTERSLALCATEQGRRQTVEVALVGPVAIGDEVLVHAGTAIAKPEIRSAGNPPHPDAGADQGTRGVAAGQR